MATITRIQLPPRNPPSSAGNQRALWIYHAVEEVEHKAVCFELYQTCYGDLGARRKGMVKATFRFIMLVLGGMTAQAVHDKWRPSFRELRELWPIFMGRKGMIPQAIPSLLAYMSASFHPESEDDRHLLEAFRPRHEAARLRAA